MEITQLLDNKNIKAKEKTEILSRLLLDQHVSTDTLLSIAKNAKEPAKATCLEALEHATKLKPELANKNCFDFAIQCLAEKAPRVKWESARLIANTASFFPKQLTSAITALLSNADHHGTVVRWSAALALGEIYKLNGKHSTLLLPAFEALIKKEEKNSIKNIYLAAIKKSKK
jgi:hypothetical protein